MAVSAWLCRWASRAGLYLLLGSTKLSSTPSSLPRLHRHCTVSSLPLLAALHSSRLPMLGGVSSAMPSEMSAFMPAQKGCSREAAVGWSGEKEAR